MGMVALARVWAQDSENLLAGTHLSSLGSAFTASSNCSPAVKLEFKKLVSVITSDLIRVVHTVHELIYSYT